MKNNAEVEHIFAMRLSVPTTLKSLGRQGVQNPLSLLLVPTPSETVHYSA